MKKNYLLLWPLVFGVLFISGCGKNPTNTNTANQAVVIAGKSVAVTIENMLFSPPAIQIEKGATVTWTNRDGFNHLVIASDRQAFKSQRLAPGESYSFTFTTPGTFTYQCNIHPSMTGTIIVQ